MTKASRLWLLLPALFALVWFLPVLSHGFRSDDFLSVYYYDRDAEAVKWGRVFEEWARPWFGVRDLYRPVVSLTFGVNWALSTSPFLFHLLNLLLLMGTATLVALTARRLARDRATVVAVAAGLVVVLHPAAVEPAAWVAARTTGLQVFFSALAYWSFVRWRDGDGRLWLPLVATILACASKEGAVLLPVSLLVLDLLRGGWPRWRTHLPFFVLVGGYLVFRKLLLGWFTTAEEGHTLYGRLEEAANLLGQLLVPPIGGGYSLGGFIFLAMFLFVGQGLVAAGTRRAMWCLPWAFVLLTPGTTHVGAAADALAGRFVFDAVPALALFVALAFDRLPKTVFERFRVGLGLLGIVVGLGIASRFWVARYGDEAAQIAAARQQLLEHAANAEPGKPFGVIGLPGLPLLQPQLWGFLTQRPFVEKDLPVVGLSNILNADPVAKRVFTDTTAIHALVADGAGSTVWDGESRTLKPVAKAEPGVVEFVGNQVDPRQFLPPRLLPPTAVAALEITSPVPVRRWEVEFLGNLQGDYAEPPVWTTMGGEGSSTWWIDTTGVLPWMVAATFGGGPAGIELTCDGEPPAGGTRVRAHATVPRLPLLGGMPEVVDRADFEPHLVSPVDNGDCVLYVLLPTGLHAQVVAAGSRVDLDAAIRGQIDFVCDVLGPCRVHWLWVDAGMPPPPGGPKGRSAFGSCLLR